MCIVPHAHLRVFTSNVAELCVYVVTDVLLLEAAQGY